MRRLLFLTTGFLGAAGVVVGLALALPPTTSSGRAPLRTLYVAESARSIPHSPFVRTRDCVGRPRSCVNGVRGLELVYLIKGRMPARPTTGTVLTDTDCAADRNGISHCSNVVRLASGRRITVRHDHSMMNDPCLRPGERVYVKRLS
jgi:hypothetical protein